MDYTEIVNAQNAAKKQSEKQAPRPTPKHNHHRSSSGRWWKILAVIVALALLLSVFYISTYNRLQTLDEATDASWSQVLNTYKRRADLVPQLVQTVQSYVAHEEKLLTEITEARANVGKMHIDSKDLTPEKLAEFQKSQQQLSTAIGRLLAVSENYPELKSNELYQNLQAQLEGNENRITVARRDYIEAVKAFNVAVRRFPGNIIAKRIGMTVKPNFSVEDEAQISTPPTLNLP